MRMRSRWMYKYPLCILYFSREKNLLAFVVVPSSFSLPLPHCSTSPSPVISLTLGQFSYLRFPDVCRVFNRAVESSTVRQFEAKSLLGHGGNDFAQRDDQGDQASSPSLEEIKAIEVPRTAEPCFQKQMALVDSVIRSWKCNLTGDEYRQVVLYAGPSITLRRPTPKESVFDAPSPSGFFGYHLKSLEYGFCFPLHHLTISFLKHFDFLPCQLVPNSHRYMAGFFIRCRQTRVRPNLDRFEALFRVAKFSGSNSGSYAALSQRMKLLRDKSKAKSSRGPSDVLPLTPHPGPFAEEVPLTKKCKDVASATLWSGLRKTRLRPTVTLNWQGRATTLKGELAASEEHAWAAEEEARKAKEHRQNAVKVFQASPAFVEAALPRMEDLLKAGVETDVGKRFSIQEGKSYFSLGQGKSYFAVPHHHPNRRMPGQWKGCLGHDNQSLVVRPVDATGLLLPSNFEVLNLLPLANANVEEMGVG
ncbi:unnamed protein product [Cuscuta campestris]|uniref:Transposase (putative) gypsy type domain-containing protein n=1 Tax=Cuscuta campestris TaxID=132261 RepID=A0A484NS04_9ASTE|nr:unnamed protein product [Cuscuta campestris]